MQNNKRRILLIDDDQVFTKLFEVQSSLNDWFVKVLDGSSLESIDQVLLELDPELILLDYHLKGDLNINDWLSILLDKGFIKKVIIVTGYSNEKKEDYYNQGYDLLAVHQKPIRTENIVHYLNNLDANEKNKKIDSNNLMRIANQLYPAISIHYFNSKTKNLDYCEPVWSNKTY